jgi:hypothetical protein
MRERDAGRCAARQLPVKQGPSRILELLEAQGDGTPDCDASGNKKALSPVHVG